MHVVLYEEILGSDDYTVIRGGSVSLVQTQHAYQPRPDSLISIGAELFAHEFFQGLDVSI